MAALQKGARLISNSLDGHKGSATFAAGHEDCHATAFSHLLFCNAAKWRRKRGIMPGIHTTGERSLPVKAKAGNESLLGLSGDDCGQIT